MPKSRFNGAGYYLSDERASGGPREEADLIGCGHCQKTMVRGNISNPAPDTWAVDGGWCSCCDGAVCAACADRMLVHGCENFKAKVERQLDGMYRRQQNAKILGI